MRLSDATSKLELNEAKQEDITFISYSCNNDYSSKIAVKVQTNQTLAINDVTLWKATVGLFEFHSDLFIKSKTFHISAETHLLHMTQPRFYYITV